MSRFTRFFAFLGGVLLVLATQVTPERVPEEPGLVRFLLILFGVLVLIVALVDWVLTTGVRLAAREREQLIATGLPATARVLRNEPRSGGNDSYLRVALTLEVAIPGRPTYVTTHECSVEVVFAGQLRPGELLPVVVSPSNREQLVIRWGEVATPPVGAVG